MSAAWPSVSVIVPVKNGGAALERCVASLNSQVVPGPPPEIVVVDNGSTDGAADRLAGPGLRVVREPAPGAPVARNRGAREARGDVLVFTDHDCAAERRWLARLVGGLVESGAPAAAGDTLPAPGTTWAARYAGWIRHNSAGESLKRPVFPFAATANLAVRRPVFEKLGGFDESLPYTDDADFSLRLIRGTGGPIHFVPAAIVFHEERADSRAFFERYRQYGEGWMDLVARHPGEMRWGVGWALRAELDVWKALARVPAGFLRWRSGGSPEDFYFRWYEFVRRYAHRTGFRRRAHGRGHWLW